MSGSMHLGRVDAGSGFDVPHGAARAGHRPRGRNMSKRILVVEDQEDLRKVLRTLRVLGPVCGSPFEAPC
jgi:hypothetical protein